MSSNALRWAIGNPTGPMVAFPPMRLWRFLMWCRNYDPLDKALRLPSAPRGVECGGSSDHCELLPLVAPAPFFSAPESRRANKSP